MNAPLQLRRLTLLHEELDACHACKNMIGPVVHGPPVLSKIFLLGQAPGPREGSFGKPFAWTAGKTMFKWFHDSIGCDEETFRARVYMAAVARCFPGKAKSGGDRKPDADEIDACKKFIAGEIAILKPELVIAVGQLAIGEVLGEKVAGKKLDAIVGHAQHARYHGIDLDVIVLPHPSGVSSWPRIEPGKTLLAKALKLVARHPSVRAAFADVSPTQNLPPVPPVPPAHEAR